MGRLSRHIFLLILFCTVFSVASEDSLLYFANHLYEKDRYGAALIEYRRVMYGGDSLNCKCRAGLGKTLSAMGRYEESNKVFEKMVDDCDSLEKTEAHFGLVVNSLYQENLNLAVYELLTVHGLNLDERSRAKLDFLNALTYAYQGEFDSVRAMRKQLDEDHEFKTEIEGIRQCAEQYLSSTKKGPGKAMLLSSVFPGLGQLYLGKKKEALGAFALVSALTGVMVWRGHALSNTQIKERRNVLKMDLAAFGILVWHRYYDGSRKVAYELGLKYNRKIFDTYYAKLNKILLKSQRHQNQ